MPTCRAFLVKWDSDHLLEPCGEDIDAGRTYCDRHLPRAMQYDRALKMLRPGWREGPQSLPKLGGDQPVSMGTQGPLTPSKLDDSFLTFAERLKQGRARLGRDKDE